MIHQRYFGEDTLKNRLNFILAISLTLLVLVVSCRHENETTSAVQNQSQPVSSTQFLPTSSPAAQNIDADALNQLIDQTASGTYGLVDSLIVIRNGHIVSENYFRDYTGETPHRLYSVSKSIASLLIAIAIDQGFIESLDQKLLDFFPEYERSEIHNWDDRKADITLEDLLTMRAGFLWDEWSSPYTTPENDTTPLFESPDWMKHMLDLPMAHYPGTVFTYNSGFTMLLSGIIRNTTGMTAREFAEQHLLEPLGIENIDWAIGNPETIYNTGWGMFMRSIDMAKIGVMVLNGGQWNGKQIVSKSWLDRSTTSYINRGTGGYGYQWWLLPQNGLENHTPNRNDIWYAGGWGGQFIFVVPLLDMVVVMNAENYTNNPPRSQQAHLLPAILRAAGPLDGLPGNQTSGGNSLSFQPSCDFSQVDFVFQGTPPTTPAIPHGPEARWDGKYINPGAVTYHNGKFHMFSNGFFNWPGVISVGYMTSEDGINWVEEQESPVWISSDVSYANPRLDVSSVLVEDDGTWVMYFHTVNSDQPWEIGRATAPSPLGPWTADGEPVLKISASESYDSRHVTWPSVIKTDDEYVMYYGAHGSEPGAVIGRATSPDGIEWTKDPHPVLSSSEGWNAGRIDRPEVLLAPDGYVMIYQGGDQLNTRGLAVSEDGINWKHYADNPVITNQDFPTPGHTTWDTALVYTNEKFYYFMEMGSLEATDIYLAIHEGQICQ